MTEYLIKFHGKRGHNAFWTEQVDGLGPNSPSLARALSEIRDYASDGYELAAVLKVECIDGKYTSEDVTEEIIETLAHEEIENKYEKFSRGETSFALFEGHLECAERMFLTRSERDAIKRRQAA